MRNENIPVLSEAVSIVAQELSDVPSMRADDAGSDVRLSAGKRQITATIKFDRFGTRENYLAALKAIGRKMRGEIAKSVAFGPLSMPEGVERAQATIPPVRGLMSYSMFDATPVYRFDMIVSRGQNA